MAVIEDTLRLNDEYSRVIRDYINNLNRAGNSARNGANSNRLYGNSAANAARQTSGLVSELRGLAGAYLGIQGVRALTGLSDSMTSITARLDMMNDGLQTTEELNRMIYESAQRSRGSYQQTANLVAKLGTLAGDAFSSNQEIIAFAEQLNKQMALSGATTQEAQAAMLQLTQGLASGTLRGEELNSVLEQTPMIAQSIAKYMGVNTGEMRELASEGAITADVVKNAMFAMADEINAKFEQMPMTWGQVWTSMQNTAIQALEPVLDAINWAANNIDTVGPIFVGAAAGVLFFAAAVSIANGGLKAMFATIMANPILAVIAVGLGIVVALIGKWVQSVGGLQIAWLKLKDIVLTVGEEIYYKMVSLAVDIFNSFSSLQKDLAMIAQGIGNFFIGMINKVIGGINKLTGKDIGLLDELTLGDEAAKHYELTLQERERMLNDLRVQTNNKQAARYGEIRRAQAEVSKETDTYSYTPPTYSQVSGIAGSVKGIEKSVNMSEEDIRALVDVAERRYVNNVNLTAQTPVITINGANTGRTAADRQNLANAIRDILIEQVSSGAARTTARAF